MQPTTELVTRSVPHVQETQRDRLVNGLNQSLADLTDLALCYKQAHWNVIGKDFSQLHELFDLLHNQARQYLDLIAERALALGGIARGTLQAAAERTNLPPFPVEERHDRRLLEELLQRMDRVNADLRQAMEGSADDLVTQDIYMEVLRGIEKQRWMVQAHLA